MPLKNPFITGLPGRSAVAWGSVRSREGPEGHEEPFGFVRVDPQGPADRVSFVVLPYNYPRVDPPIRSPDAYSD